MYINKKPYLISRYGFLNLFKIFFKNFPVYEPFTFDTSFGVPVAIIVPPLSPPSGPKSII